VSGGGPFAVRRGVGGGGPVGKGGFGDRRDDMTANGVVHWVSLFGQLCTVSDRFCWIIRGMASLSSLNALPVGCASIWS